MDTIVALSSGRPPAAIAVIRISGPGAMPIAAALADSLPPPRRAALRPLRDAEGALLDRALVLAFPGPGSATGEDLVELHCHGGGAVTRAVLASLCAAGARMALPGEFTRRALTNGRIDLAEAEGLADLLSAETEAQRRAALAAAEGQVSRAIQGWMMQLADLSAQVEASLDFAEEDDVASAGAALDAVIVAAAGLRATMRAVLARPPVERLRDGIRVVIGGPPNSGKSTLLNLMTERDAAIVTPIAGTTRDRIEAPVQRHGVAYLLVDTAGLTDSADPVERMGVDLAGQAIVAADLLLWMGDGEPPRDDALWVHARADLPTRRVTPPGRAVAVRADRRATIEELWRLVEERATVLLPMADDLPLRESQRKAVREAVSELSLRGDPLIAAEQLRLARGALARVLGLNATEAMLDALFSRFCIGK